MRRRKLPLVLLVLVVASCRDTAAPEPPHAAVELAITADRDEQGILGYIFMQAWLTNADGTPIPDVRVDWSVASGDGLIGRSTNLVAAPLNPCMAVSHSVFTDAQGMTRATWSLGPHLGEQTVEARVLGTTVATYRATATPGVVLVGTWRAAQNGAQLPSDTMRVHAVNAQRIAEAFEHVAAGLSVRIHGVVTPGAGVDTTWLFQLDPAYVRTTTAGGSVPECFSGPPVTQQDLDRFMQLRWYYICPWALDFVRIEDVPADYLEHLARRGDAVLRRSQTSSLCD